MKKQTRLATSNDINITNTIPFSVEEIKKRQSAYYSMTFDDFRKQHRNLVHTPIMMEFGVNTFEMQFNKCYNPFCKWYGLNQKKYDQIKSKPSRYKLGESGSFVCNDVLDNSVSGFSIVHTSDAVSNWSVVEEIKRLTTINSVAPVEVEYAFHKDNCVNASATPFENKELFYRRGKSSSNSQKYQCKECKKITNILPYKEESFNYHQGRNDVLVQFAQDIFARIPVKRTCEILDIASSTYYNKLELLYKRCLEFLEKYETKPLKTMTFDEIWLNTDMMIYYLNNVRQKGKAKGRKSKETEKRLPTYLVASADMKSRYVFRNDIAYDYNITHEDIEKDTEAYKCDHTYSFLRKNERLKYPYYPQAPTSFDSQSMEEYYSELAEFERRKDYVSGCHVKPTYTSMAHYWLLDEMINTSKWYFVSDDDNTLKASIFRVFSKHIKDGASHYFTCQSDKELELEESGRLFYLNRIQLKRWGRDHGYNDVSIEEIALQKIKSILKAHNFYDYRIINGITYPYQSSYPIESPLADKDEGRRLIKPITNTEGMSDYELANKLVQVNSRAINNYFQEIRRRINILERPLVTARGKGKSYIYANYNPKYAQYITTIFRTFYNFCWVKKQNGALLTPAQRLGITDKVFDVKDIVYFR